jgi:signal peptide peptidase SppA
MNKRQQLFPQDEFLALSETWLRTNYSRMRDATLKEILSAKAAYESGRGDAWADEYGFSCPADDDKGYALNSNGTALLNMVGPLSKNMTFWQWIMGGTSTRDLMSAVSNLLYDDQAKQVALWTDTPGGEVSGSADLSDLLYKLAQKKPVLQYVSDCSASCGLWIGSSASQIWCNPTATNGAMGVFLVAPDFSKMAADQGITVHVVKYGEFKGAGTNGTAITDDQLAEWQRSVDAKGELFVKAVARGRGMSFDQAKKLADGRVYIGAEAVKVGLADKVGTFEDALKALESGKIAVTKGARAHLDTNDVQSTVAEPIRLTMDEHSDSVLTAVRGLTTLTARVDDLKAIRTGQGRSPLSEKVRGQLAIIRDELEGLLSQNPKEAEREPSTGREVNDLRQQHLNRARRLSALGVK